MHDAALSLADGAAANCCPLYIYDLQEWQNTNGANLVHWEDRPTPSSSSQVGPFIMNAVHVCQAQHRLNDRVQHHKVIVHERTHRLVSVQTAVRRPGMALVVIRNGIFGCTVGPKDLPCLLSLLLVPHAPGPQTRTHAAHC